MLDRFLTIAQYDILRSGYEVLSRKHLTCLTLIVHVDKILQSESCINTGTCRYTMNVPMALHVHNESSIVLCIMYI